jgi:hypothetical protein
MTVQQIPTATGFGHSLLAGRNVDHVCGVRNMRDLQVSLASSASARPLKSVIATIAALHLMENF